MNAFLLLGLKVPTSRSELDQLTDNSIRLNYLKSIRASHPDKNGGQNGDLATEVLAAYHQLETSLKRIEYWEELSTRPPPPPPTTTTTAAPAAKRTKQEQQPTQSSSPNNAPPTATTTTSRPHFVSLPCFSLGQWISTFQKIDHSSTGFFSSPITTRPSLIPCMRTVCAVLHHCQLGLEFNSKQWIGIRIVLTSDRYPLWLRTLVWCAVQYLQAKELITIPFINGFFDKDQTPCFITWCHNVQRLALKDNSIPQDILDLIPFLMRL